MNLFASKTDSALQIAESADHLLGKLNELILSKQAALRAQGDEHADIDLRLVERIEDLLDPIVGPSGCDDESWFQSMDVHGDGVRHLEFKPGKFPTAAIPELRALLVGEHAAFCILCWAPLELSALPGHDEGIVIFSDTLLLTPKLASAVAST